MAVNLAPPERLSPIDGIEWGVADAAIKRPGHADVAVMHLCDGATSAAVFTRNAFAAAPVILSRQRLAQTSPRALLVNSGNANAGTGAAGLTDAERCTHAVADALGVPTGAVLPFSTGVIGERLPVGQIRDAIAVAVADLRADGWLAAAQAVMTTDTVPKGVSRQVSLSGGEAVTLTGIAKGSGMIRPDMATMLAFVGTDANMPAHDLQAMLQASVADSFNSITVDGDTSTNDACFAVATGRGARLSNDVDRQTFHAALQEIMLVLAQAIVRDAEGATKFIEVCVAGARDTDEARTTAFTVAHSPLVKTACFAGDPNWGRILAAVGRAGIRALDIGRVGIRLDDVAVIASGEPPADYREADAAAVMANDEFTLAIDLGRGTSACRIWTCDLSYDYVKINAEYRS